GGTHGVEDRAADALRGESLEGNATVVVVAPSGFDEPERPGPSQVFAVDVTGEVDRYLEHDVLHQRQVLFDALGEFLRVAHCESPFSRSTHPADRFPCD